MGAELIPSSTPQVEKGVTQQKHLLVAGNPT